MELDKFDEVLEVLLRNIGREFNQTSQHILEKPHQYKGSMSRLPYIYNLLFLNAGLTCEELPDFSDKFLEHFNVILPELN